MTIEECKLILRKNEIKIRNLNKIYDPYSGIGSPIERIKLCINKDLYILIPKKMKENTIILNIIKSGSILTYCSTNSSLLQPDNVLNNILRLRMEYDFEYWCVTCVKIQDKLSKKITPLTLRRPQLKLFKAIYDMLIENKPIRIIVLKARQWGGSTLIQVFMAWIQFFHRTGWHSVVVADVEDQARNIRSMYSRLSQYHPHVVLPIVFSSFEGSTKNKIISNRDCIIYMGSMQKPDSLRSADVMMAHLSEVGLWKATDGKRPEDLVQSVGGTVPLEPYTMIVMESTAKGVGNFFHKEWSKAVAKENGYMPLFVAWYEIEIYSIPFSSSKERMEFVLSMSDKEQTYFDMGATLEGVNWYRLKKHTDSYDDWRMGCEFPSSPTEAFQSTGRRAHSPAYVQSMRKYILQPKYIGDLYASSTHGMASIDNTLHFESTEHGTIHLWALPDIETEMKRRYIVSMDIGGRGKNADWSVISVIDRFWLSSGGVEECIGTCKFHLDQDLAVWKAVQLSVFYNNALLVIEANSLDSKGSEGDHTLTILDEIKGKYDNLYCRTDPQRIVEGAPERYGFFTSRASKSDLVNQMNKRLREQGYIERDSRALDEIDHYEIKEDGTFGAVDGEHDDIYMSRAIGLKASQGYEMPYLVTKDLTD